MRPDVIKLTIELKSALKSRAGPLTPTALQLFQANAIQVSRLRRANLSWVSIAAMFREAGISVAPSTLRNYGALYLREGMPIADDKRTGERGQTSEQPNAWPKCPLAAPAEFSRKTVLAALSPLIVLAVESGRPLNRIASELTQAGLKVSPITLSRLLRSQRKSHD